MGLAFYFRIIAIMSYSKKFKDTHYTHSNITFCSYKKDEKAWKILFQVKKKFTLKKVVDMQNKSMWFHCHF